MTSSSQDMDFGQCWGFGAQFWPKKMVSPIFQPDQQVNPENKPSKDSKTAVVSEFPIIGQSSPSLTGLYKQFSAIIRTLFFNRAGPILLIGSKFKFFAVNVNGFQFQITTTELHLRRCRHHESTTDGI